MPAITLPDGSERRFAGPVAGTTLGGLDRPRPRESRARDEGGRQAVDLRPMDRDAAVVFVTRKDPEALGADPPRRRACAGRSGAGSCPRHPGHHRPGHRGRLLLRFRPRRAVHARRLPGDRSEDARDRRARPADRARGVDARRGDRPSRHGRELQGGDHPAICRASETITLYRQGDWNDLCRGPHLRSTGDSARPSS